MRQEKKSFIVDLISSDSLFFELFKNLQSFSKWKWCLHEENNILIFTIIGTYFVVDKINPAIKKSLEIKRELNPDLGYFHRMQHFY